MVWELRMLRFHFHANVFVHLVGNVFAHVLGLGAVEPEDVPGFIVGLFGSPTFESLVQILVGHKNDDRAKWMIMHIAFFVRWNPATQNADIPILEFNVIMLRANGL